MNDLYKQVKAATGCSYESLGEVLGCTKQNVYLMVNQERSNGVSMFAVSYLLEIALDEKIEQLKTQICELEELKVQVRNQALMPEWSKKMMNASGR